MFKKQAQKIDKLRWMKWFQRVVKLCVVVVCFQAIVSVLNYIYVDEDLWFRNLWHHYYKAEGKIDTIYLGSSHVYCDINPEILDEKTGQYHFNLATPRQPMNGSYYLLKEAVKGNKLSHVYLELYYICTVNNSDGKDIDPVFSEDYFHYNWKNTDYMKLSYNKLAYWHSIGDQEKYPNLLFPFVRFRQRLDDWEYVRKMIAKKQEPSYKTYQHEALYEDGKRYVTYTDQGFNRTNFEYKDEKRIFWQEVVLEKYQIREGSEGYLRKIIRYCKEENIPITLFVSPIDHLQLISTEGYDHYIRQLQEIAAEYGVDFYDFNLAKETYLPVWEGKYFRDAGHLNAAGSDMFTAFSHQVMSNEADENEKYFYKSYEEKLQNIDPDIYGLYYRKHLAADEDAKQMRTYKIASNRSTGLEYQVAITPEGGEEYILRDFSEQKEFTLPAAEHGTCRITARMPKGNGRQAFEKSLTVSY